MIRRSFRIGLWLGVVAALGYMVVRTRQRSKPAALPAPESGSWPPIEAKPVAPAAPVPAPTAPTEPAHDEAEAREPALRSDAATAPPAATEPTSKAKGKAKGETKRKAKAKAAEQKKPKGKAKAQAAAADDRAWVEPSGGSCPGSHPLKANESSKIFHVPGGLSYDRTRPDRCYADESAAEADGYRRARR